MLRLVARHGQETLHFPVPEGEAVLGSAEDAGIWIPFAGVSRRHATLTAVPGGVRLVDAGSKNGLVREGVAVREVVLVPGVVVQLGHAHFTVEEVSSSDDEVALLLGPWPSPDRQSPGPRRRAKGRTDSITPGDDRGPVSGVN